MYTYTVDNSNTVEVFLSGQDIPILRQPQYPNGDTFDTKAEAESWAKLHIDSLTIESAPSAPAGKGLVGKDKPSIAQKLEYFQSQVISYGDNVPQPLLDILLDLESKNV